MTQLLPSSSSSKEGLVRLPADSELVADADEEVFLLYTALQRGSSDEGTSQGYHGLGHVDSRKDTLCVQLELGPSSSDSALAPGVENSKPGRRRVKSPLNKSVEITLAQDTTALRSRKGDTGSVLWMASVVLAQLVLRQYHNRSQISLLDQNLLAACRVLELGAGTGLLSVALSPLVQSYTVTDIGALIPLIRKNISLTFPDWSVPGNPGSNITVCELDWLALHSASPSFRPRLLPANNGEPFDLVLVVDCIYHPSLLPALVETINAVTISLKTAVLVVVELRADDVIRDFLELWLSNGGWEIWRIGGNLLEMTYVMWVGWKTA